MASGIQAVSPRNNHNMNLISESLMFNNLSKDEYRIHDFVHFKNGRDYSHYSHTPETYGFVGNTKGAPASKGHTNSSQGYDSDESSVSYSSRETAEIKGPKAKHSEKQTANDQNEFCQRPCVLQPNLYQPNVNYNKNSKYYFRGSQHTKFYNSAEDTKRKIHGLMKRFQSRAYKMKIDLNPNVLLNGGPWDPLNQAIWDIFVNKIQKEDTYINKLNLWKSIFLFLKMCLNNYGLYLVGSTMSGFALEGSDIDICLLTRPFSTDPRVDSLHHLNYLQHALLKNDLASEAELVMAKVPILKFKNKDTGFEVDLNCNNVVGIQNTRLLYCYAQLDWRVRPLVVMVKIWAQTNNINDAKNMTVSSYSWTLMVIHYLQCGVFPAVLPCLHNLYPEEFESQEHRTMDVQGDIHGLKDFESENTRCLGDLLIGFFHYYSYFNYQNYAISVRTGSRLPIEMCKQAKSPKNDPHQWKLLCIEEPFDLSNTARSVFDLEMFKHIKLVIMASYKELAAHKALSHILPIMHLNGQR